MADEPPPFEDQENEPEAELFDDPAPQDDPFHYVDEVKEEKSEEVEPEPQPYETPVPLTAQRKEEEEEEEEEEEATKLLPPAHEEVAEEEEDRLSVESDEVKVKPPELVPSSREVKVSGTDRVLIIEKGFVVNTCVLVMRTAISLLSACQERLPTLQS